MLDLSVAEFISKNKKALKVFLALMLPILTIWTMALIHYIFGLDLSPRVSWYALPLIMTYFFFFVISVAACIYIIVNTVDP